MARIRGAVGILAGLAGVFVLVGPGRLPADEGAGMVSCPAMMESQAPAAATGEFVGLFNGKDTAGWTPTGSAEWLARDGCLVGTQTTGKGGDLTHEKEWDNFELRATYRVKWPANSGFWFRFDKGKGYQFDILKYKKPVAFSGTLYCPGKMFITTNLNEAIENRDDCNEARIWAVGDRIIMWLNGKRVSDCTDKTLAKGRIGIQVHGGNDFKGMEIVIKRLEVRPLPADEKPPPMTEAEKPPEPPPAQPAK